MKCAEAVRTMALLSAIKVTRWCGTEQAAVGGPARAVARPQPSHARLGMADAGRQMATAVSSVAVPHLGAW